MAGCDRDSGAGRARLRRQRSPSTEAAMDELQIQRRRTLGFLAVAWAAVGGFAAGFALLVLYS